MFSRVTVLRAPKLLSCAVTEEILSSASTATGKLTPRVTTVTLRLRRSGPTVGYDLRLERDKKSGKLFLNEVPDFIAQRTVCLTPFFPIDGSRAPHNALCVSVVNGEVLESLTAKELHNVFGHGNDLTMQLTVNTKAYARYHQATRRMPQEQEDGEEDGADETQTLARSSTRPRHTKIPAKRKTQKAKSHTRKGTARSYEEDEANDEVVADGDDGAWEGAEKGDDDEYAVSTPMKKKKMSSAKRQVKSKAKIHRKTRDTARRNDKKRKPHAGRRDVDDEAADTEAVIDAAAVEERQEDDEEASAEYVAPAKTSKSPQKTTKHTMSHTKGRRGKRRRRRNQLAPTHVSESPEKVGDADDASHVENNVEVSVGDRPQPAVGDEEDAWFRPSAQTEEAAPRATIQF